MMKDPINDHMKMCILCFDLDISLPFQFWPARNLFCTVLHSMFTCGGIPAVIVFVLVAYLHMNCSSHVSV